MTTTRRNPPRWFVLALFGGMMIAVAGLAALGALLYDPEDREFTVGERTYIVPPADISALNREPQLFVRIRPSNKPFELLHDQRQDGMHDRSGIPQIFSVNDQVHHNVFYSRHGRSVVVCRRASTPTGGCGTWINYGGAVWSILFPEARSSEADKFVSEAMRLLKKYDTRSRNLLP